MTAKINDTLTGTIGLATNGGTGDPRSTNQTLGEGWTRKGIALDLAYVDWKPVESFGMSFGKMPQPWYKVSGYFFDNDINPEGIAARFGTGPFFANAYGMWLSERSSANDATLLGGQLGMTGQLGGVKLTGARRLLRRWLGPGRDHDAQRLRSRARTTRHSSAGRRATRRRWTRWDARCSSTTTTWSRRSPRPR